jgi:hypothetical protein
VTTLTVASVICRAQVMNIEAGGEIALVSAGPVARHAGWSAVTLAQELGDFAGRGHCGDLGRCTPCGRGISQHVSD